MKRSFSNNTAVWMLTKRIEKKLDANYTRMLLSNIEQVLEQQLYRHSSRNLWKLHEVDTTGEVGMNSSGPIYMDEQRQDDQLELWHICLWRWYMKG